MQPKAPKYRVRYNKLHAVSACALFTPAPWEIQASYPHYASGAYGPYLTIPGAHYCSEAEARDELSHLKTTGQWLSV